MSIEYKLYKGSHLLEAHQYIARVQARTANLDQVVDRIIERGSTVGRADVASVLEDFFGAVESLLLDGWNVSTPGANYRVSVRGVFEGQGDSYDPSRHQITARASAGRRLRRTIPRHARVEKVVAARAIPIILEYVDVDSGETNETLTPGGQGRLVGKLVKFDQDDPAQGIFFVAADGSETRVESLAWNGSHKHIFLVPATLSAGEYELQVRAAWNSAGDDVRSGALLEKLTVA
jgi:hypothetical protein